MSEFARDPNSAAFACLGVMFILLVVLVALLWWHGRCYVRKRVIAVERDARLLAGELHRIRDGLREMGKTQHYRGDEQPLVDAIWRWEPRPETKRDTEGAQP